MESQGLQGPLSLLPDPQPNGTSCFTLRWKKGVPCLALKVFPGRQGPASKFSFPTALRVNSYSGRSGLLSSTSVSHQCGEILKSLLLPTLEHSAQSYLHKKQETSTYSSLSLPHTY